MSFDHLVPQIEETERLIVVYRHTNEVVVGTKIKSIAGAAYQPSYLHRRPRLAIRSSIYSSGGFATMRARLKSRYRRPIVSMSAGGRMRPSRTL